MERDPLKSEQYSLFLLFVAANEIVAVKYFICKKSTPESRQFVNKILQNSSIVDKASFDCTFSIRGPQSVDWNQCEM